MHCFSFIHIIIIIVVDVFPDMTCMVEWTLQTNWLLLLSLLLLSINLTMNSLKARSSCKHDPAGSPSRGGDVVGLCWHKPTKLAHSFLKILFLCLFLSLRPFQLYFIPAILLTTLRFFSLFFRSYFFCLIGPYSYISLHESLLQSWYNPLWLTGLKAPN